MNLLHCCVGLLPLLVCDLAVAAHPGADPAFGSAGIADMRASALGLSPDSPLDMATVTRAAGIGGQWYVFASNYENYALARFGPNGQLDSAFGSGGAIEGS